MSAGEVQILVRLGSDTEVAVSALRLRNQVQLQGIASAAKEGSMGDLGIPERVFEKYKVSTQNRERVARLEEFDMSFVTEAFNDDQIRAGRPFSCEQVYPILARFGKADYEIARLLEKEFKRFVAITLLTPSKPHAPCGAVDQYWHFFILHSEEYVQFCEEIWGNFHGDPKYRHHYPAKEDTRAGMLDAYLDTRGVYVDVWGEPALYARSGALPVEVWTSYDPKSHVPPTSGDSYSGIIEPISAASSRAHAPEKSFDQRSSE